MLPDVPTSFVTSTSLESDTSRFVGVGRTPSFGAVAGVRSPGCIRLAVSTDVDVGKEYISGPGQLNYRRG